MFNSFEELFKKLQYEIDQLIAERDQLRHEVKDLENENDLLKSDAAYWRDKYDTVRESL